MATVGQAYEVLAILANRTDWDSLDKSRLQERVIKEPDRMAGEFYRFLQNDAQLVVSLPTILKVDRTKPFDPTFVGDGWTIEEQDERSLVMTEVDLAKVRFETMLKSDETYITGEEKLRRLNEAGPVRLDARIFQILWENQHLIPENWKEKIGGKTHYIYFDGTVLRAPNGNRCALCLYWDSGHWNWSCRRLGIDWSATSPSATLASV